MSNTSICKNPNSTGQEEFPNTNCGHCKNAWVKANSSPGDTIPIFNEDGSPLGMVFVPVITKGLYVVGTSSTHINHYSK
jgi:hypothetical protein